MSIVYLAFLRYNIVTVKGKPLDESKTGQEVDIMEENNMTQAELILYLETLAELIEAKAETAKEAADIIRDKADKLK